jgi:hypothetical protein
MAGNGNFLIMNEEEVGSSVFQFAQTREEPLFVHAPSQLKKYVLWKDCLLDSANEIQQQADPDIPYSVYITDSKRHFKRMCKESHHTGFVIISHVIFSDDYLNDILNMMYNPHCKNTAESIYKEIQTDDFSLRHRTEWVYLVGFLIDRPWTIFVARNPKAIETLLSEIQQNPRTSLISLNDYKYYLYPVENKKIRF